MNVDDSRHASNAGYLAHHQEGEDACIPCRAARARYDKGRKYDSGRGRPRTIDVLGSRRRIQALVALGWTYGRIGERIGLTARYVHKIAAINPSIWRSTAERIAAAYEEMSMTLPPTATRCDKRDASYARTVARKRGWPPPLAWDDIDNDPAPPSVPGFGPWNQHVDEAAVQRVVDGGSRPRRLTHAESAEVVKRLLARGFSTKQIEDDYGIKPERYKEAS